MSLSDSIQKILSKIQRRFPPFSIILAAIFVISANLSAMALGETFQVWAQWQLGTPNLLFLAYLAVFILSAWFIYLLGGMFFRIFSLSGKAEKRQHLVLFLSNLLRVSEDDLKTRGGMDQSIYECLSIFPDSTSAPDLSGDLLKMAQIKENSGRLWKWEMPLRAIHWHLGTLKTVTIFGSASSKENPGSVLQVRHFVDFCRRYPELGKDEKGKDKINFIAWCKDKTSHSQEIDTDTAFASEQGWDFENYEELKKGLELLLRDFNYGGVSDREIMIDFTGGMKVTSVVATGATFNRALKAQYIQTNKPYNAIEYDVFLVFSDKGEAKGTSHHGCN